jgi:hypothetical protein
MIFLYAGTTSSLTYSRPWSPMTGSRTDMIILSASVLGGKSECYLPQKNDPGFFSAFSCRSMPIVPTVSTTAALGA